MTNRTDVIESATSIPSADVDRTESGRAAAKRRAIIRTVVEVAAPLVAFYGLRAAGGSEYFALLTATVVAGIPVVYGLTTTRRLDPYAGYLMLMFGLTLAVAMITTDARLILAGQTLVGAAAAVIFLASCMAGKPMTQFVAARFMPDVASGVGLSAALRSLHVRLSAIVGVGLLIQVAVLLAIIFTLPFDIANGLVNLVGCVGTLVIGAPVLLLIRRFKREQVEASG
ncbi:hypothetical protein ABIA30_000877 [Mycobacterium sp. MAA66]|uniref:VC0807 family protein n=1 Tax=Mycobacterium sp. MAA66 TaxID=3156297 RepID=UPI003519B0A4